MNEQTNSVDRVGQSNTAARPDARECHESCSRRAVLAATVGTGALLAVGQNVRADDGPTVRVESTATEVEVGETIEATVSISAIPDGLSGLLGEAHVSNPEVATITGASFPDWWSLTQDPEISEDGSSINLVAADTEKKYEAGDTDVELFTLELEGQGDGDVELEFDELIEAADGTFYTFDVTGAAFSVVGDEPDESDGSDDDGEESGDGDDSDSQTETDDENASDGDDEPEDAPIDDDGDDASPLPGAGIGTAIVGIAGGIGYLVRERFRGR